MEAVGAVSAVLEVGKAAWQLNSALYHLYQDTKSINKTVEDLNREVKALANTCDTIHEELEEAIGKTGTRSNVYDTDNRLWLRIQEQTTECKTTLNELSGIVSDIQEEGGNIVSQGKRQIKMNSRKEDLLSVRSRLHSHTESLHTILLVTNIKVSHLAPGLANQELVRKVGELQNCIHNLQSQVDKARSPQTSDHSSPLIDYAKEVIQSGVTLYEASVTGGSVIGGVDAATANTRVAAWLSSFECLRRDAQSSEPSDDRGSKSFSVFSEDDRRTVPTDLTSTSDPYQLETHNEDFGDDSDVELSIEIIEAAMKAGSKAFEQEDWLEAEMLYEEALEHLRRLSAQHRPQCDTFELQYKLAVCVYHTRRPDEAEHALTGLTQQATASLSEAQTGYICDAGHLLSLLYLRMGKLESAKSSCEQTVKAKTRLFGKQHDSRFQSLALMSRVYQLLGNRTRERIFRGMIPEERQDEFWESVQDVELPSSSKIEPISAIISGAEHDGNFSMGTLALIDSESARNVPQRTSDPWDRASTVSTKEASQESSTAPQLARAQLGHQRRTSESGDVVGVAGKQWLTSPRPAVQEPEISWPIESNVEARAASPITVEEPTASESDASMTVVRSASKRIMPLTKEIRGSWLERFGLTPQTELAKLICDGRLEDATNFLKTCEQESLQTKAGEATPLHFAAVFGDLEVAQALVAAGAALSSWATWFLSDIHRDTTPFRCAVGGRHPNMIEFLVRELRKKYGPEYRIFPHSLLQPLWLEATDCCDPQEIIDVLHTVSNLGLWQYTSWKNSSLTEGRRYQSSVLHQACQIPASKSQLRKPVVGFLMEAKMNVLLPTAVLPGKPHGRIPLHLAILNDAAEVVPLLLERQSLEQLEMGVNESGDSLHLAVGRAAADPKVPLNIVETLLEAGANASSQTGIQIWRKVISWGWVNHTSTPLQLARDSDRPDLKRLVESRVRYGNTRCNRYRFVSLFYDKKIQIWRVHYVNPA